MEKEELREELLKQVGGLGTEVGTGLALDKATAPLLAAGPLGWAGYGAINFGGGVASNYAAQRIRGEEDINYGELISSGLLGIIPFTSLRFGKRATQIAGEAGTVKRAIVGGAGMGASDRFIQSGLNEGELPSPTDVAVGTVAGGALGGTFQKSFDEFGKIAAKFKGTPEEVAAALKKDPAARRHMTYWQEQVLKAREKGNTDEIAKAIFKYRKAQGAKDLKLWDSYEDYAQRKIDIKNSALHSVDVNVSPHMRQKLNEHARAFDDEMLQWDRKAQDRRIRVEDQLELKNGVPKGPEPIYVRSTETGRKIKAGWSTGEEVTPEMVDIFYKSSKNALDGYEFKLDPKGKFKVGKVEDHHKGVVRQIFDASNGLNKEYRIKSAQYMQQRIGFELGYRGRNAEPLPVRFHPRIHGLINKRVASSPDKFNLNGIAARLGLPDNWQSVLTYNERIPIYNELADAIRDSVEDIHTFWDVLISRTDLGSYDRNELLELMIDLVDLDNRLRVTPSPSFMAQTTRTGWSRTDTATEIINEILVRAKKPHLVLPIFKPITPDMGLEAIRLAQKNNAEEAILEAIISGQSSSKIFQAYGIEATSPTLKIIKQLKKAMKTDNRYSRSVLNRHKSIRLTDPRGTQGMGPDD